MSWRKETKKFICQVILERTGEPAVFDEEGCESVLKREALDWLFIFLGTFTYIYLIVLAVIFFGRLGDIMPKLLLLADVMEEPYLGALGIYVILKEIRKRRRLYPSRYWGELFVALWVLLMITATALTIISPQYDFDKLYKIILSSGLVVVIIYAGSLINKP